MSGFITWLYIINKSTIIRLPSSHQQKVSGNITLALSLFLNTNNKAIGLSQWIALKCRHIHGFIWVGPAAGPDCQSLCIVRRIFPYFPSLDLKPMHCDKFLLFPPRSREARGRDGAEAWIVYYQRGVGQWAHLINNLMSCHFQQIKWPDDLLFQLNFIFREVPADDVLVGGQRVHSSSKQIWNFTGDDLCVCKGSAGVVFLLSLWEWGRQLVYLDSQPRRLSPALL